jgi:hypothetical protein
MAKAKTKAVTGKTKQKLAEELDVLRHQLSAAEGKASLSESIITIATDAINRRVLLPACNTAYVLR